MEENYMKKCYAVFIILICIILGGYLQYGRNEKVVNMLTNTSERSYELEFSVIANKNVYFR